MMASPCNPPNLLNQKFFFWILALVSTIQLFSVTETAEIQCRGEIGGNVTFHCPYDKQRPIKFLYFQKGDIYVNGFHTRNNMTDIQTWENTRLDHNDRTTVHMYNLNASHSGDYNCHIEYKDGGNGQTVMRLHVTANYTKPQVTTSCGDGLVCVVTCVSHNGFPGTEMMWDIQGSQMWKVVNKSEQTDNRTMMVNSSSTAHFNCSTGELRYLRCHVGDVTSDMFSVCTPKNPPGAYPDVLIIIIPIITITAILVVVLLVVLPQLSKGSVSDRRQEWRANGCEGETVALNVVKGEEKAS